MSSRPVTEVTQFGIAVTVAPTGYGMPVAYVPSGGLAVTTVPSGGIPIAPDTPLGPAILLSASSFLESAATNTQVGVFSVTGGTGTYTFTLTGTAGGKFTTSGTNGTSLRTVGTFDYETTTSYVITARADNGAGSVVTSNFTINVLNVDDVTPVWTSSATPGVYENATLAHTLVATVDTAATVSYSIVGGVDAAKFEISGTTLRWAGNGVKDFEAPDDSNTDNVYVVQVRATSSPGGLTTNQTINVTVADIIGPTITSSATVNVNEAAVLAHALTASESVTWAIVGGADQAKFEIFGTTLRWLGNGVKDFEAPDDANADNAYLVQVRATSVATGEATPQSITVTVLNVAAPTITSSSTVSVAENAALVHTLTASETVTWAIIGGADQARFELSGSVLRWLGNGTKDFEAPDDANTDNVYVVQVRATSTVTGETTNQTITVTVTNVVELPVNTVIPALSGTEIQGSTLTVTTGTWTENASNTYTYQWYRTPTDAISGATGTTYVLQAGDVGFQIYCKVTATNSAGAVAANSNTTGIITSGGPAIFLQATFATPANEPWVLW